AAFGIFCEELPQMQRRHLWVMRLKSFPRLASDRLLYCCCHVRFPFCLQVLTSYALPEALRAAFLDEITVIRSFQDFTNDSAPSFWSCVARASTSMPALVNCAITSSQLPPSAGSNSPNSVWVARAFNVPSGMVLTV